MYVFGCKLLLMMITDDRHTVHFGTTGPQVWMPCFLQRSTPWSAPASTRALCRRGRRCSAARWACSPASAPSLQRPPPQQVQQHFMNMIMKQDCVLPDQSGDWPGAQWSDVYVCITTGAAGGTTSTSAAASGASPAGLQVQSMTMEFL